MILIVYTAVLVMALPLIMLWRLYQVIRHGKYKRGFFERAGSIPKQEKDHTGITIWVHAASVGEVLAAEPIIKELKNQEPSIRFYLTSNTDSGHDTAKDHIDCLTDLFQTPFDLPWIIDRFISAIQPSLLIIMETEIWPNMISECHKRGIPVIIANGRISDRSFPRYLRFKWFIRPVLSKVSAFIMQSSRDAERIIALGGQETAVIDAGNVKYDREKPEHGMAKVSTCIKTLNWFDSSRVFVAGSTHQEEEKIIYEAFGIVLKQVPDFKMILAPRHVNRVDDVFDRARKAGLKPVLCTACESLGGYSSKGIQEFQVLVLDVMGELFQAYSAGFISFVGGSLQPVGGHNVLEPAALAKPVLFGPFTANFADAVNQLLIHGAGRRVTSSQELADAILDFTKNPEAAIRMGQKALAVVQANQGAVKKHVMYIRRLISAGDSSQMEPRTSGGRE